jgi:putative ABC transport system permease protein
MIESVLQDLRYAARVLRRAPLFSAVVALVLAMGIGANTAIFSLVHAVLLRPLPYPDPERLVVVREEQKDRGLFSDATAANFVDWRHQSGAFSSMAARRFATFNLTGGGEPERVVGAQVTDAYFTTLGVLPMLGRLFTAEDDQPGTPPVALLGQGLWMRRFGGDRAIVGRTIDLDGRAHTVIGVLPAGADLPGGAEDLWVPLALGPQDLEATGTHRLAVIARLGPNVGLEQARSEMTTIAQRLENVRPQSNKAWTVNVAPLHETLVENARPTLIALLGAVGLVVLIVCANVASLLLARAARRQREIAVRAALGASRTRLLRQLLFESVLLAVVGGAAGLALGAWSVEALAPLVPASLPFRAGPPVDRWVLGFTLLLSLGTGVLFGLAPALHASRARLSDSLKEGTRSGGGGRAAERLRGALMISEMALALVLLIGAGLLLRSFVRLQSVALGFDTRNLLTLDMSLPASRYAESRQVVGFYREVLDRVAALPGVAAAAATSDLPVASRGIGISVFVEGAPPLEPSKVPTALYRATSTDYLRSMGIRLLRGRPFDARDRDGGLRVAVINASMARLLWGQQDPTGRRFKVDENVNPQANTPLEVIGIASDIRHFGFGDEPQAEFYVPYLQAQPGYWQFNNRSLTLALRTTGDPRALVGAVRSAIAAVDKDLPLYNVRTMDDVLERSLASRRASMELLALFAAAALLLASIGLYGVVSYSVSQRTHEFGVRMAMGARERDVLRLVLGRAARLAVLGLGLGFAAALALSRVLATLVFGITVTDPVTFGAVGLILLAVALLASYLPARRAARLSPVSALRYE